MEKDCPRLGAHAFFTAGYLSPMQLLMSINRIIIRKGISWFHRWVGLSLGLLFVGYGLTGSYIVFMDEFEALLKPSVKYAQAPLEQVSLAQLAVSAQLPEGSLRIRVPENPWRTVEFLFHRDPALRLTEYIDPTTGQSVASHRWSSTLTGIFYSFHHDLFLGPDGKTVTAIQAVLVWLMLMIGLWLWVWVPIRVQPLSEGLKPAAFMRARTVLRRYLELHKFVGIYTLIALLVVVSSGIVIARPDWFMTLQKPAPLPEASYRYAAIDEAIARSGLPARGHQIRIRAESVTLTRMDNGHAYLLDIAQQRFLPRHQEARSSRIYDFIRDVHGGRYWGGNGAWLTFVTGFLPLLFYVTGVIVWWKKRRNRQRNQRRS